MSVIPHANVCSIRMKWIELLSRTGERNYTTVGVSKTWLSGAGQIPQYVTSRYLFAERMRLVTFLGWDCPPNDGGPDTQEIRRKFGQRRNKYVLSLH